LSFFIPQDYPSTRPPPVQNGDFTRFFGILGLKKGLYLAENLCIMWVKVVQNGAKVVESGG